MLVLLQDKMTYYSRVVLILGSLVVAAIIVLLQATPLSEHIASYTASTSLAVTTTNTSTTSPIATTIATTTPHVKRALLSSARAHSNSVPQTADAGNTTASSPKTGSAPGVATRIENPYAFPPESSDQINVDARAALVNIICLSRGAVRPISGSGVIIDPRGVILTNAHVAQYVLLSENPLLNLSCTIRAGSPARATWTANVLYIPSVWVAAHYSELNIDNPTGTGEHDYALLLINGSANGDALPQQFPAIPYDTRNGIGFAGDQVLVATYPAEFIGGTQIETDLFADSSVTTIGQLLTFGENTIDAISLGGIIEAQAGSSGGGVVNPWGRLIGIVTTTTEATTTAARDLRAITLSYISSDLKTQTGSTLNVFLAGDLLSQQANFNTNVLPSLLSQYMTQIKVQ